MVSPASLYQGPCSRLGTSSSRGAGGRLGTSACLVPPAMSEMFRTTIDGSHAAVAVSESNVLKKHPKGLNKRKACSLALLPQLEAITYLSQHGLSS